MTEEDRIQAEFFRQVDQLLYLIPALKKMHAVPNGGLRAKQTGARLKKTGVRAGVLDTSMPVPTAEYHGLYIEFKTPRPGSKLSKEQDWWVKELRETGYRVEVCRSATEAVDVVLDYLGLATGEIDLA